MFFAAGILVWLIRTPPKFLRGSQTAGGLLLLPFGIVPAGGGWRKHDILLRIGWFFTKAGAFVFVAGWQLFPSSTVAS